MGLPEIGGEQTDMHSDFLGLLPALSLPPVHCSGTHGLSPSKQAGRRPAGSRGLVSIVGKRPNAASTHLRLHVQFRTTRARGAQWKRTRRPGSRDPRSLAGSRHKARALRAPGGYQPGATPATFEFQPPPPFSPPSASKGQSSPAPQPRANRSALRLPRPHPARPAPSPSCFAGHREAG